MKRIIVLTLSIIAIFTLAACSQQYSVQEIEKMQEQIAELEQELKEENDTGNIAKPVQTQTPQQVSELDTETQPETDVEPQPEPQLSNDELLAIGCTYYGKTDYTKGFECFEELAEMGDNRAMLMLGICYDHGTGVEQDYEAAFGWYGSAYENGNERALLSLAQSYLTGEGVEKDVDKYEELLVVAEQSDDSELVADVAELRTVGRNKFSMLEYHEGTYHSNFFDESLIEELYGSGGSSGVAAAQPGISQNNSTVALDCPSCDGGYDTCSSCNGTGRLTSTQYAPDYSGNGNTAYQAEEQCRACRGTGKVACSYCGGSGVID